MLFNYIEWRVNPEIFPDLLPVRWYGLLFACAFFFGYIILMRIFKYEKLPVKLLDSLATYVFIATIIGARFGHVFFYEPAEFLDNPISILYIWQGGLASHGAAIGIMVGVWLFSKRNDKPYLWTLDRLVIVVALGGFFIRMGNLMNSEIYGIPTTLPWGFIFVNDLSFANKDMLPRHPTQIYEGLSYLALFFFLLKYYWMKNGKPKPGFLFGVFLIVLFAARFLIEFIKTEQVAFEKDMALNMGQILSLPFIIAGLIIMLRKEKNSEKNAVG
jgi:phosphatidylglycerol---prolipoprotein diacylglyceryl transferase